MAKSSSRPSGRGGGGGGSGSKSERHDFEFESAESGDLSVDEEAGGGGGGGGVRMAPVHRPAPRLSEKDFSDIPTSQRLVCGPCKVDSKYAALGGAALITLIIIVVITVVWLRRTSYEGGLVVIGSYSFNGGNYTWVSRSTSCEGSKSACDMDTETCFGRFGHLEGVGDVEVAVNVSCQHCMASTNECSVPTWKVRSFTLVNDQCLFALSNAAGTPVDGTSKTGLCGETAMVFKSSFSEIEAKLYTTVYVDCAFCA